MDTPPNEVTQLLRAWREGDETAQEKLLPLVYDELRRMAGYYLRGERPGHTLQTGALVHEAYLLLAGQDQIDWQNRSHFFGMAAQAMRHVLVDYARARNVQKRGGKQQHIALEDAGELVHERAAEMVALDEALQSLAKFDARKSRIIELRYFGGLTVEETAEVLGISPATVVRDWTAAKVWLLHEMNGQEADDA